MASYACRGSARRVSVRASLVPGVAIDADSAFRRSVPVVIVNEINSLTAGRRGRVLVVDDTPENVNLLVAMLNHDYDVTAATNGADAVVLAERNLPDVILLDVMMPGMSGFEVCEKIAGNPETADIPVMFLTALTDSEDKMAGFALGAVDYITKPFSVAEVRARVATQIALRQARAALAQQNVVLEALVVEKTRELREAHERLKVLDKAKDGFLGLISHELRSPLNGLLISADLLIDGQSLPTDRDELIDVFKSSRERLIEIMEEAMLLTEIESAGDRFPMDLYSLDDMLTDTVQSISDFSERREVQIEPIAMTCGDVICNRPLFLKAICRMLTTAVKFAQPDSTVRMTGSAEAGVTFIRIEAQGYTVPDEYLPTFFDVFSVTRTVFPGGDLGLGPPVAAAIFNLFQGSVAVENHAGPGIRFTVEVRNAQGRGDTGIAAT